MQLHSVRRLTGLAALSLALMTVGAACGNTPPVAPTTGAPSPTAPNSAGTGAATPTAAASHTPTPSTTRSHTSNRSTAPPTCLGAAVYTLDLREDGPAKLNACIAVGGQVILRWLGPDGLSATPWDKVSCDYEGAVHVCRLIQTGTVRLDMTSGQDVRTLTVVIAKASTPPKPSPACLSATTPDLTLDGTPDGPPYWAMCFKLGIMLRIEDVGPGGLSATPADAISCNYAAGVHVCRFVKAGTVTLNVNQAHWLTVVVIK